MGPLSELFRRLAEGKENPLEWIAGLPTEIANAFVHQRHYLSSPQSSNIAGAEYHLDTKKMFVHFNNSSTYVYFGVEPVEAFNYAMATSKGKWLWNNFRIPGSKTGSRKSYQKIS